jgi:hypothetical protein
MNERRRAAMTTPGAPTEQQEVLVDSIQEAVAEAVADQEERASKARERPAKKRSSTSTFLLVVLLGFVASGFYSYFEIRKMAVPLDEELGVEAEAVGVHLYSVSMRIDRFKGENGHYPASLDRAGIPADEALTYKMISDTEYSLTYSSEGITHTYHSNQPPSQLLW